MTQTDRILMLLRLRGESGLTPMEALTEVGSLRLAARIDDAKKLLRPDEEIVTERASANGKTFARYVLRRRTVAVEQRTLW